jgi:hypothetical protein
MRKVSLLLSGTGNLGVPTPRPPVEEQDAKLPGAAPQTPMHILVVFTLWHVHCFHLVAAG